MFPIAVTTCPMIILLQVRQWPFGVVLTPCFRASSPSWFSIESKAIPDVGALEADILGLGGAVGGAGLGGGGVDR